MTCGKRIRADGKDLIFVIWLKRLPENYWWIFKDFENCCCEGKGGCVEFLGMELFFIWHCVMKNLSVCCRLILAVFLAHLFQLTTGVCSDANLDQKFVCENRTTNNLLLRLRKLTLVWLTHFFDKKSVQIANAAIGLCLNACCVLQSDHFVCYKNCLL